MTPPDRADSTEVTLGEVSRGLTRLENEMAAMRADIGRLNFVSAQVYASDTAAWHDRVDRLENSLHTEVEQRREAETSAAQRAWQSRWSITLALIGMPISIAAAVLAGLITATLH